MNLVGITPVRHAPTRFEKHLSDARNGKSAMRGGCGQSARTAAFDCSVTDNKSKNEPITSFCGNVFFVQATTDSITTHAYVYDSKPLTELICNNRDSRKTAVAQKKG